MPRGSLTPQKCQYIIEGFATFRERLKNGVSLTQFLLLFKPPKLCGQFVESSLRLEQIL